MSARTLLVTGGDPTLWSGIGDRWTSRGWQVIHAHSDDEIADVLASSGPLDVGILDVSRGTPDASLLDWFRVVYPQARFIVVQDSEAEPVTGGIALTHPLNVHDLVKIVDALIDE